MVRVTGAGSFHHLGEHHHPGGHVLAGLGARAAGGEIGDDAVDRPGLIGPQALEGGANQGGQKVDIGEAVKAVKRDELGELWGCQGLAELGGGASVVGGQADQESAAWPVREFFSNSSISSRVNLLRRNATSTMRVIAEVEWAPRIGISSSRKRSLPASSHAQ